MLDDPCSYYVIFASNRSDIDGFDFNVQLPVDMLDPPTWLSPDKGFFPDGSSYGSASIQYDDPKTGTCAIYSANERTGPNVHVDVVGQKTIHVYQTVPVTDVYFKIYLKVPARIVDVSDVLVTGNYRYELFGTQVKKPVEVDHWHDTQDRSRRFGP